MASSLAKLYHGLGTVLLASWTITALGFAALDVLNTNRKAVEPIASISLFTFLAARLVVSISNARGRPQEGTVAHLLASADNGSRKGALVIFALCWTWLYELLMKGLLLLTMTVIGGAMAAVLYNEGLQNENAAFDAKYDDIPNDPTSTALVEIDQFKEQAGFDPTAMFKTIPPRFLVYLVGLVWVNFLSLGLYVLGHTAKSMLQVLSSPSTSVLKVDNPATKPETTDSSG